MINQNEPLTPLMDNLEAIEIKDCGYVFVGLDTLDKPSWFWVLLGRIVILSIIGFSLLYYQFESLFIVILVFILVVPMEKIFPRHKGQKVRRAKWKLDLTYALTQPLLNIFGVIFAVIVSFFSFTWVLGLVVGHFGIVDMIPDYIQPIVAFVLFDFVGYWAHRWYHEVPELWKFHAIHHSPEHMDWISGFRLHPMDFAFIGPGFFFLIFAGFEVETTGIIAALQIITGLFLHANVSWKLRPLQRLIPTPEFHHWHHVNEKVAHCSNYSGFLPLWDIIFGTYYVPNDKRPEIYGVDDFLPDGLLGQLMYPIKGWNNPLRFFIHPFQTIGSWWRFYKQIMKGIWISTFRIKGNYRPLFRGSNKIEDN